MANRYMRRCSASLITRETRIKGSTRFNLIPVRMAIIKKTKVTSVSKKRENSYSGSGNVNWYNHYGEQYEGSLKKIKK